VLASVDPPAAQLAMNATWHLPFRWVSDPGGEQLARPLEAWNAADHGGVFHPLVLLLAPDGRTLVEHRSRDFADRASDDDVLSALRELSLPPLDPPPPWDPGVAPQPTESAFRPDAFAAYFRGVRFSSLALAKRMRDDGDRAEVAQTESMAASFLQAWKERRAAAEATG
jgi:hypothetical protein